MTAPKSHFIDGQWLPGTGPDFASSNPATGDTLWQGRAATAEEVDAAVDAAHQALFHWGNLDLAARIAYLQNFAAVLTDKKSEFAETISQETGKPLWEALNETNSMVGKVAISIDAYRLRCPETFKHQGHSTSIVRHRPHGVMAVLGPFNFPGHLPNGHIVPALLAGNTVVFKPSELTPLVASKTMECWQAAQLPNGVINLVQGEKNTGKSLSEHPGINGLLFTGSRNTGLSLAKTFAAHPEKILALEMGGNNPLVVSTVKDGKAAAYLAIQSAFLTSGQRCTCARRLIVINSPHGNNFLSTLISMTKSIRVGAYTERPEPFMGPVIAPEAAERLLAAYASLKQQGGVPLLPLERLPKGPAFLSPGIIDVTPLPQPADEELFGPLLQVIRVPDLAAALEVANSTKYGLSAGLLSDDRAEYETFYKHAKAGIVNWNTPLTGASSAAPFGGVGQSGNHRPSALYAADYCAYPVASLEAETVNLQPPSAPGIDL